MSKVVFEKVPRVQSSLLVKEEKLKGFHVPWHIHPEFEIALIKKGEGRVNIGDATFNTSNNELLLLGSSLPHSWEMINDQKASQTIAQFVPSFLGDGWLEKVEFEHINKLLKRSSRGIRFLGKTNKTGSVLLDKMKKTEGFDRIILLLRLLSLLADSEDFEYMSSIGYINRHDGFESEKLNKVYDYILQNFKNELSLNKMSDITHMTPASFSRFFKASTKKPFSLFLNEVRVGNACRLLQEKRLSISEICFESGFTNLSNFNRQFKRIMEVSPSQFQGNLL